MRLWAKRRGARARVGARARTPGGAASPRRRRRRPCCPATRTCSAPSRCCSATTWRRTRGRSSATSSGCARPTPRPTSARSAPARWPARACRSTRTGRPRSSASRARSTTRSTPSPTATSSATCSTPARSAIVHLSRLAEEVVLFTSQEFGFAQLDDTVAHGSLDDAAEEEPAGRGARARRPASRSGGSTGAARRAARACRWPTTATCRRTRGSPSRRSTTWPGRWRR